MPGILSPNNDWDLDTRPGATTDSAWLRKQRKPRQVEAQQEAVERNKAILGVDAYARALEFGHSNQAPFGMVRITATRWQPIVDQVARGLDRA